MVELSEKLKQRIEDEFVAFTSRKVVKIKKTVAQKCYILH